MHATMMSWSEIFTIRASAVWRNAEDSVDFLSGHRPTTSLRVSVRMDIDIMG